MGLRTGLSVPARRLPERLDDLHGPWQGTVVLPVHLSWHQFREFDVARRQARLLLYGIVSAGSACRHYAPRFPRGHRRPAPYARLMTCVNT